MENVADYAANLVASQPAAQAAKALETGLPCSLLSTPLTSPTTTCQTPAPILWQRSAAFNGLSESGLAQLSTGFPHCSTGTCMFAQHIRSFSTFHACARNVRQALSDRWVVLHKKPMAHTRTGRSITTGLGRNAAWQSTLTCKLTGNSCLSSCSDILPIDSFLEQQARSGLRSLAPTRETDACRGHGFSAF